MLVRYLKAQASVLLFGGLVGPIFLVVYFALGTMTRPYIQWMFWVGLFVTAADVLAALALANAGAKAEVKHRELAQRGVLVGARITGISDTPVFVNDQQMIKVNLHFDVPGFPGFDAVQTMASSPTRMQILNGHTLVALVEPGTERYEIDWDASALVAGVVPAEFTLDADHKTYDLTGRAGPLMDILRVLQANGIPLSGTIDIRSNPVVRQQVMAIVRRAGNGQASAAAPAPVAGPVDMPSLTVSQRLQELETLRATGTITDAEYNDKRKQILADL
ncbi:MAG: SHOCT domain-containing protein [Mycobacterium sp.]